ncbi:hypothetical protein QCN27_13600 [Cereibacter sp. SYSU M97828]|nr:hypothetical protein [Cereibacter flavus]
MIKLSRPALALAAIATTALPAFAAIRPETPSIDLAFYDAMPRIGEAQLPTDPYCDRSDTLAATLGEEYGEEVMLAAMNPNGTSFRFWASDEFGTWTVSYVRADGVNCVVGSGTGWTEGDSAAGHMQALGIDL